MEKDLVIKFSGDSGDGIQLIGTFLANAAAKKGYHVYTYPSYPADMRAPKNSLQGVSSFQLHIGDSVSEPGDEPDMLVCMNPASFKKEVEKISTDKRCMFIYDGGTFTDKLIESVNLDWAEITNKREQDIFWALPATKQCEILKAPKSRNIYILGAVCFYLGIEEEYILHEIGSKFSNKKDLAELNISVLKDAYNLCNNLHICPNNTFNESKQKDNTHDVLLSGCDAACEGLKRAADNLGKRLFLASYPITPATNILVNLEKARKEGVIAVQAEDEIAACGMALGASCAGAIGVTSTSGPGMCLKSEMINLAVISEMPLVIIDVQRGGPSTGMPTKTEQSDLNIALYGRSGDSPLPVIAASSPSDCYEKAYKAVKIAVEKCTPVILLMDAYIGNGLEMTNTDIQLPDIKESANWVYPGHGEHVTLGGSEVDNTKTISTNADNHMFKISHREFKTATMSTPSIEIFGAGDICLVGYGSSFGKLRKIHDELAKEGIEIGYANITYINPLHNNFSNILERFDKVIVIEQNNGQLKQYLQSLFITNKLYSLPIPTGEPIDVKSITKKIKSVI